MGQTALNLEVAPKHSKWASSLAEQPAFYGFRVQMNRWGMALPEGETPFAVIFLPAGDSGTADNVSRVCLEQVTRVRARCPISQLFYVGVTRSLDSMVSLMRAGIDITVQSDAGCRRLKATPRALNLSIQDPGHAKSGSRIWGFAE